MWAPASLARPIALLPLAQKTWVRSTATAFGSPAEVIKPWSNVGAIQPRSPDCPVGRPVKVVVDRQPDRTNRVKRVTRRTDNKTLSDKALVDLSAIELCSTDGSATGVRPVHVCPAGGDPVRVARAGDEALLDLGAVESRASDRLPTAECAGFPVVGPIDVLALDTTPAGPPAMIQSCSTFVPSSLARPIGPFPSPPGPTLVQ